MNDLRVPSAKELVGDWRVVTVNGDQPPAAARRGLNIVRDRGKYWAAWHDGVNSHSIRWAVTDVGTFVTIATYNTAVGCGDVTCGDPSGFGVANADAVRMSSDGDLVFVSGQGSQLAVYARA